jgi:hypothetical protein
MIRPSCGKFIKPEMLGIAIMLTAEKPIRQNITENYKTK